MHILNVNYVILKHEKKNYKGKIRVVTKKGQIRKKKININLTLGYLFNSSISWSSLEKGLVITPAEERNQTNMFMKKIVSTETKKKTEAYNPQTDQESSTTKRSFKNVSINF